MWVFLIDFTEFGLDSLHCIYFILFYFIIFINYTNVFVSVFVSLVFACLFVCNKCIMEFCGVAVSLKRNLDYMFYLLSFWLNWFTIRSPFKDFNRPCQQHFSHILFFFAIPCRQWSIVVWNSHFISYFKCNTILSFSITYTLHSIHHNFFSSYLFTWKWFIICAPVRKCIFFQLN